MDAEQWLAIERQPGGARAELDRLRAIEARGLALLTRQVELVEEGFAADDRMQGLRNAVCRILDVPVTVLAGGPPDVGQPPAGAVQVAEEAVPEDVTYPTDLPADVVRALARGGWLLPLPVDPGPEIGQLRAMVDLLVQMLAEAQVQTRTALGLPDVSADRFAELVRTSLARIDYSRYHLRRPVIRPTARGRR